MRSLSRNSLLGVFLYLYVGRDHTNYPTMYRTVPTHDDILVPETLLKKRKSQEKEREARSAELEKKKKVGAIFPQQPRTAVLRW